MMRPMHSASVSGVHTSTPQAALLAPIAQALVLTR